MKLSKLVFATAASIAVASAAPSIAQDTHNHDLDTPAQSSAPSTPGECPIVRQGADNSTMGQMPQGMMGGQQMMQMMQQMHTEMQQMHKEMMQMHKEMQKGRGK